MFAALIALAALAPSALATVSVTAPIGTTTWSGGQQQTISWQDNGQAPSLQQFGPSQVSIYVGNVQQQTQLQLITNSVDVSTTSSILFTPDPSIGPNSAVYFIRFESLSCKDPATPQYPCEAFSAKFTMAGMSGTFNSTVQAQIDGASANPIPSPSAPGAPGASAPGGGSSPSPTPSKPSSASGHPSSSASATGAAKTGAASSTFASAGLVGTVAALIGAMLF